MDEEERLIDRIAKAVHSGRGPLAADSGRRLGLLQLGIGDDAAILAPAKGKDWVLTCDAFLEGVHFLAKVHPPDSVGYKSVVRAASDVAAMGAVPRLFLLTLALPGERTGKWLDEFLKGMARAARELGMSLAGGDTSKTRSIFISVTVLGEAPRGAAVRRSGARPGDLIFVSGALGRAQLGLEPIRHGSMGWRQAQHLFGELLRPHLYPKIHVDLGAWLARPGRASAVIDISDGLSTDLARLCGASGVGARIVAERIPKVAIPTAAARRLGKGIADPVQMALHGGEDYELLFTVPRGNARSLRHAPGFENLTAIGEITRGRRIMLATEDGNATPLRPGGWDPFRKR